MADSSNAVRSVLSRMRGVVCNAGSSEAYLSDARRQIAGRGLEAGRRGFLRSVSVRIEAEPCGKCSGAPRQL